MLKKIVKPNNVSNESVELMLAGAKKRRRLAQGAITASNSRVGITPNLMVVK